ncbi:MAG TPA: MGMT family protein, partial [Desulfopila sp.]|nr:MGMT family protein [Desulfopila sp.]
PAGKICTYGIIAARAGNPSGARQVARVLHSCSGKYRLPWHRVVNREGKISLSDNAGYGRQKILLEGEGVVFDDCDRIDMDKYLWWPDSSGD